MKRIFFIIISLFLGQALNAMEQEEQKPNLSQEERNELGEQLVESTSTHADYFDALKLIRQGANLNCLKTNRGLIYDSFSALMNVVERQPLTSTMDKLTLDQRLSLVRELIEYGANANLLNNKKENALFKALGSRPPSNGIIKLLLNAGINMYQCDREGNTALVKHFPKLHNEEGLQCVQLMVDNAIQLSPDEKEFLKTWALVNHRLRNEGRGLVKVIEKVIAHYVVRLFARDACNRVEQLGWSKGLLRGYKAQNKFARAQGMSRLPEHEPQIDLVEKYLDIKFLEDQVKKQLIQEFKAELIKDSK